MPLEHFGESWSHYGSRPLSESGLSSGATNGRASSDGRDRERGLETFHENSGKDDTEDSTFLSKLTGVSRSVSWGRSTLNQRKDATLLRTSSGSKVDSRMPGKPRPRSHQASASLNMSPSLSSPVTPEDTSAQTSSPASSAAFSLRSLSRSGDYEDTVSNHSRTTSRHSLRDLPLTDAYESSAMYNETTPPNAESNPIAQSHSRETNELSKLSQPYNDSPHHPSPVRKMRDRTFLSHREMKTVRQRTTSTVQMHRGQLQRHRVHGGHCHHCLLCKSLMLLPRQLHLMMIRGFQIHFLIVRYLRRLTPSA